MQVKKLLRLCFASTFLFTLLLSSCNHSQTAGPSAAATPPGHSTSTGKTAQATGLPSLTALEALVNSQQDSAAMATNDPALYGWNLFFYTGWPALTSPADRGKPDPQKQLGQPGMTVWETWKNTSETFLANGHPPLAWTQPEVIPPPVLKKPFQPSDSGDVWENMTGNSEVDGFPAKDNAGQDILYEIRSDQNFFDYVVGKSLYNIDGQIQYAATSGGLSFSFGVMEVKASWRWLDTDKAGCQAQDYFTANAFWPLRDNNGNLTGYKTGLMGLTGLHILTKALQQWVWITLEQVNNESCTAVTRRDPIPANIVALNQQMQALLKGTKWANYEVVGVQISPGTADNPVLLANTQIETAFQSRSSCLTCHAVANIATHKPVNPADDLRKSFLQRNPPVSPPYYIGPPPDLGAYKSQDFVWSLRRAAWFQK
jgi:hypothetical protein